MLSDAPTVCKHYLCIDSSRWLSGEQFSEFARKDASERKDSWVVSPPSALANGTAGVALAAPLFQTCYLKVIACVLIKLIYPLPNRYAVTTGGVAVHYAFFVIMFCGKVI